MKLILLSLMTSSSLAIAQNTTDANKATPEKPKLTQEQLETKFKTTLTQATLTGRWCAIQEGKLSPEKKDRYSIESVSKIKGDQWLLKARIQYGGTDLLAPVPVQVKWAGDTAVIVVDDFSLPGGGTYSARVLVYNDTYAGTWSAEDHGGLLNGIITHAKESAQKSADQ